MVHPGRGLPARLPRERMESSSPVPVALELHRQRRVLDVAFEDGSRFELPCEYLRVFSPAAEARVGRSQGDWPIGREAVNIERMTPVGSYAVQLVFDDGHDTGVYSWETLYELGRSYRQNWAEYRRQLERSAQSRNMGHHLRLLYVATLAPALGLESEEVELPEQIDSVADLLAWLRERGPQWREGLDPARVRVTVNRQFAASDTPVRLGDEVAITPISL